MRSRIAFVALCAPLFLHTRPLPAQGADSSAAIAGRVRAADQLPGFRPSIQLGARGTNADSAGRYRIDRLPPGTYRVQVRAFGYMRRDTTLTLSSGHTTQWDVRLEADTTWTHMAEREQRDRRAADSANVANGAIDSAAARLLPARAAGEPPYERFGAQLLSLLAQKRGADENTVVSPLSAGLALALAAGGARDATYRGLMVALDAGSLDASALAKRDSLLLLALSARRDVTLEVANALWLTPKYKVQPAYVAKAIAAYASQVRSVALTTKSGIDTINAWVKEKTHGKIERIFDEPRSDTTALVITNAVYFHGLWLKAFDVEATRPLAFHSRPGQTDSVPGMQRTANLGYLRGPDMQAIRLPYRGGRAALFVILPDSGVRVDELERRLARDGWPNDVSAYRSREVHLRLPRIHAQATLDLVPPLKTLGASIAFDCGRADFRAMLVLRPGEDACIGDVTQKTYVDIDEKGTEAAAVTAIGMMVTTGMMVKPPPIEFIVDRPFLFVLRDEVSGVPLFMGRIVTPGTSLARRK